MDSFSLASLSATNPETLKLILELKREERRRAEEERKRAEEERKKAEAELELRKLEHQFRFSEQSAAPAGRSQLPPL